MIQLGHAIAVSATPSRDRLLAHACDQFALAEAGALRPDATLLKEVTSLLLALREGSLPADIGERVRAVQLAAFAYAAYFAAPDEVIRHPDPWLRDRLLVIAGGKTRPLAEFVGRAGLVRCCSDH